MLNQPAGVMKSQIPTLHHKTLNTLSSYFPSSQRPVLHVRAPNRTSYSPSPSPSRSPSPEAPEGNGIATSKKSLNILLLSAHDGRDTLVDLTKTIAEMSQKGKLTPADVTIDLIHAEIEESCGFSEPDLLVVMTRSANAGYSSSIRRRKGTKGTAGSHGAGAGAAADSPSWTGNGLCLQGYPPWQVRLTEIL